MKKRLLKGILCSVLAAALTGMGMLPSYHPNEVYAAEAKTMTGTYQDVVESFDWGPGVSKIIVHLDGTISGDAAGVLDKSAFRVETTKTGYDESDKETTLTEERGIIGVYTCDAAGNQSAGPSSYIAINLAVSPSAGSPFYNNQTTGLTEWNPLYEHKITLTKEIVSGSETITGLTVTGEEDARILAQAGVFKTDAYTYGSGEDVKTLHYAYYESSNVSSKKGLVIWLHGTGERGTDPMVALLGNKAANWAGAEAQNALGGADILVPQCPERWLPYQTGLNKDDVNTPDQYQSVYTETLKKLIENYVSGHPDIDTDRIYIGGASNGGSMTMNMILNYPDYFAAAYFASEGYADRYITDEQIQTIKNIPMWFVYAAGDTVNEASKTAQATYDRLVKANAQNVHLSYYAEGVVDKTGSCQNEDGTPYTYNGHFSWVYLLNNDCTDNGTTLMSWLGAQKKTDGNQTRKPSKITSVKAVANKNGKIKVSWKKQSDVKGYVVYVSADKKFGTVDKKVIKKSGKNSTVITKCKKGTTYYIRVCAYNKSATGKTVYGKYSKTIKVKAK